MINDHDAKKRRCPMLGHELTFAYCREPGRETPCAKIFDCWWERFDITGFIRAHYPPEAIAKILEPKQPKVASLYDIVRKVQKHESS